MKSNRFRGILKRFEHYFKDYMDKPFRYILILDDAFPKECCTIFMEQLLEFTSKYHISHIALGTKLDSEFLKEVDEFKPRLQVCNIAIIAFQERDFFDFSDLYTVFPICNTVHFITKELKGRIFPKDISFENLFRILGR